MQRPLSIRIKILFSVLIPLLFALILMSIASTYFIQTGVDDIIKEQQQSVADLISNRMADNLQKYPAILLSLISHPNKSVQIPDPEQFNLTIHERNLDLLFDQGVAMYDSQGKIIRHTNYQDSSFNALDPALLINLTKSRRHYYSPLITRERTPYISLYVPVLSQSDDLDLVVEGRISPEYSTFGSMLVDVLELREGTTGYGVLIDQSGNILYQRFVGDLYDGIDLSSVQSFFIHPKEHISVVFQNDLTGKKEYTGYSPIDKTGWGIIARENRDVLYQNLDQYFTLTFILCSATAVITLILITILVNAFLNPISTLISRIKEIKEGNLNILPIQESNDEIGVLASEFNRMVTSLNTSFDRLDTARRRYRMSMEQAYDGIIILDPDSGSTYDSNYMARQITGYSGDELKELSFASLLKPGDREKFLAILQSLTEEGMRDEIEGVLLQKDNNQIDIEMKFININLDDFYGIQVTLRDISKKKEADKKIETGVRMLAKTQETLATLNDQIRNPLSIISIYAEECPITQSEKILAEVTRIDHIIDELDKGWIESDKVRQVMMKHYDEEK